MSSGWHRNDTAIERLERNSIPEPNSGCLLWIGAISRERGYGVIGWRRKYYRAHRFSWEVHLGPVPEGMLVCHKCDVPLCVNPAHLFLGTSNDNMQDKMRKGRYSCPRGENLPQAVLTNEIVRAIRSSTDTTASLSRRYGASEATIRCVRQGKTWRHVLPE